MNVFQRLLYNGIKKAAEAAGNKLFKAQFFALSDGQSIPFDDSYESQIKQGYSKNALFYSVASTIIEKAACIPVQVMTKNDLGEYEVADSMEANELRKLIHNPNQYQSYREFMEQAIGMLTVTGNSYWYAPRLNAGKNRGKTLEMHIAPTPYMEIVSGGWTNPIKGYRYVNGYYEKPLDAKDVMQVRKANLDYDEGQQFYGQSPLKAGANAITKMNAAQEAQMFLYENRGAVGLVTGGGKTPFTEQQAQALQDTWKRKYGRKERTGDPVFTEADVKWQKIVMSSEELGFSDDWMLGLREICNLLHAPSGLFGDSESNTFANYSEARKALYTDAIVPQVDAVWSEFNRWMTSSYGEDLQVVPDYSKIPELQPDKLKAAEVMERAMRNSAATPNEFRESIGLPRLDDPAANQLYGQMSLVPMNMDEEQKRLMTERALERLNVNDYPE